MRLTLLPTILLLPFLIIMAACAGGGDQEETILIEDAEAVALRIGDVPSDFLEVEGSAMHVTNAESCAGAQGDERDECLSSLEEWGRLDGYQVEYAAIDSQAYLTGVYRIFGAVSLYRDQEGAAEAYRVGSDRLQEELRQLDDAASVEISTVGEESLAFVTLDNQTIGTRDVPISLHVVDFRRGNVLMRIGVTTPTALASVDDAVALAQRLDDRILQAAGRISPTAGPTATP
ncbi:MAG: hypothetical protein JSU97_04660 [Dehalococcoidia bacterium]|nr:MAG: hypothetical protein JSU97_04660 [Dehalococcoidia bacterium]